MINTDARQSRIPLPVAAGRLGLTRHGLLKILKRTQSAIRDDGRWFVLPETVEQLLSARRALGLDRLSRRPTI
jgi:hypothetical protein